MTFVKTILCLLCGILTAFAIQSDEQFKSYYAQAKEFEHWIIGIYEELHATPELQYNVPNTSRIVQRELTQLGLKFQTNWAKHSSLPENEGYGLVGDLGSGTSPCVLLRADMDGLPIRENTGLAFSSSNDFMHACGHDAHMAMLLGALRLLSRSQRIDGTIRFMFQPAEEGGAGAKAMLNEGVLSLKPQVDIALAQHVFPEFETGSIGTMSGALTSASGSFRIVVEGQDGHAAHPSLATDPIPAAVSIVESLYVLVAREGMGFPDVKTLISVTSIQAGKSNALNVIPRSATIKGTLRCLADSRFKYMVDRMKEIVELVSQSHRCAGALEIVDEPYPCVLNDETLFETMKDVMSVSSVNSRMNTPKQQLYIGEDFGFVSQRVPSLFTFIGIGESSGRLHDAQFKVDKEILSRGSAYLAAASIVAMDHIQAQSATTTRTHTRDEL